MEAEKVLFDCENLKGFPEVWPPTVSLKGRVGFQLAYVQGLLLLFSHSIMFNSLQPHGLQHARFPCPSPSPRVHSNSRPLSQWCHPTISSSVAPFSPCLQSFPASLVWAEVLRKLGRSQSHRIQFSRSVMSDSLRPVDWSMPGLPVNHQLPELVQTHVHPVGDAIQSSHPLLSPSPPTLAWAHKLCSLNTGICLQEGHWHSAVTGAIIRPGTQESQGEERAALPTSLLSSLSVLSTSFSAACRAPLHPTPPPTSSHPVQPWASYSTALCLKLLLCTWEGLEIASQSVVKSPCCPPQTTTALFIGPIPTQKKKFKK